MLFLSRPFFGPRIRWQLAHFPWNLVVTAVARKRFSFLKLLHLQLMPYTCVLPLLILLTTVECLHNARLHALLLSGEPVPAPPAVTLVERLAPGRLHVVVVERLVPVTVRGLPLGWGETTEAADHHEAAAATSEGRGELERPRRSGKRF